MKGLILSWMFFGVFLILFSVFQIFSCSRVQEVEFAKKFKELKDRFQQKYDGADENLGLTFREALSRCAVPRGVEFDSFLDPVSEPQKISISLFIAKDLKIPFIVSLLLKDAFDYKCDENGCRLNDGKSIKHSIKLQEKKIQEDYIFREINFESEYADIEVKSYYSTKVSESVSEIKIRWEDGYVEIITYGSRMTQSQDAKIGEFIIDSENGGCYTYISLDNVKRSFEILVLEGGQYEKFSGDIESNPLCSQKPKGNINRSTIPEEIGEKCDSVFESSNIDFLIRQIQKRSEKDEFWLAQMRNISGNFKVFEDEIKIIEFAEEMKKIVDSLNFVLIYEGKERIKELNSKLDESLEKLRSINVAFPIDLGIYLMPDFVLPASYQVNENEKLFFESVIYFIKFILTYLESTNLTIEENTRNSILNTIRSSQRIQMRDKVGFFVRSIKNSPVDFLTTEDGDRRMESYQLFRTSLTKMIEFSKSLTVSDRTGFFKFVPGIPKIPNAITEVIDGFADHKTLSYYFDIISSFLKAIYGYSGNKPGVIIYLLDKVSEKWFYDMFEINIRKLILGNLRQMIPGMYYDRDNFIIEWECNGLTYSYQMFPESITCTDTILTDSKHFYEPQYISDGKEKKLNPFYSKGIRENGSVTRFPYIFFLDPTFDGSVIIRRGDLLEVCSEFPSEKENQICQIAELLAFLTK